MPQQSFRSGSERLQNQSSGKNTTEDTAAPSEAHRNNSPIIWTPKLILTATALLLGLYFINTTQYSLIDIYKIYSGIDELEHKLQNDYKIFHKITEQMRSETMTMAFQMRKILEQVEEIRKAINQFEAGMITKGEVVKVVKTQLRKFTEEDHVQVADYALQSAGASIIKAKTSRSYHTEDLHWSIFGMIIWTYSPNPDHMLQPNIYPGNCWAFPGTQGHTLIQLSEKISPAAVTIQHVSQVISPAKDFSSAPKDFAVLGFENESAAQGTLLGQFRYNPSDELIKSFKLMNENRTKFQFIQLKVLSNWGNKDFTCIYRFRVHQDLPKQLDE
ncbi:SUN domain-containing protein 3 [Discoglossus pictus]